MVHAPGEGAVCRHRPRQRDGRPRARVRPAVDTRLDSDEANRATTTAKLLDMEFLSISPDGDVRPRAPPAAVDPLRNPPRATSLLRRRALPAATRVTPARGGTPLPFLEHLQPGD